MARYIDADVLLGNLKRQYGEELGWQGTTNMSDVGMMIEDAPTADVAEVKHGEWRQVRCGDTPLYACSECGKNEYMQLRYCPNCGAKMDGGEVK